MRGNQSESIYLFDGSFVLGIRRSNSHVRNTLPIPNSLTPQACHCAAAPATCQLHVLSPLFVRTLIDRQMQRKGTLQAFRPRRQRRDLPGGSHQAQSRSILHQLIADSLLMRTSRQSSPAGPLRCLAPSTKPIDFAGANR